MSTIGAIAIDNGFSILVDAINFIDDNSDAELLSAVTSPGDLTVFAPTNAAFGQLAADLGFVGDTSDTAAVTTFLVTNVDVATLRAVVEYHVLGESQTAAELTAAGTFTTLQGGTITLDGPTLIDNEPDLINPSLSSTDIPADNGIVHIIDRVLLPVDLPGNDVGTFTDIVLESGTGFDTNNSDFDLLREAVVAANLAGALADPDADLTVFAPDDAAFIGLAQTLGFGGSDEAGAFGYIVDALRLLSAGEDPIPLLETILLYHVGDESLQASQVLTGAPISTLAGADIQPDGTTLGDIDPDLPDPGLIATDIQAANGVLHVLDGVLIPADILNTPGAGTVDFVIGDDGSSFTRLNRGNDYIDAKAGFDIISAGRGDDVVLAGAGSDKVRGGQGNDTILGEEGRDLIHAGKGADVVDGGSGFDNIFGQGGDDIISGGEGGDRLFGNNGDDMVMGDEGRDLIFGNAGNDTLDGGVHSDVLAGGGNNDVLIGGEGNDQLRGGSGDDTFVFAADEGRDRIFDFTQGHDLIDLTAFGFSGFEAIENEIGGSSARAVIELDGTDIIVLGVGKDELVGDDFLF